ncbi:hypothetical protein BH10CHL1_BH10CHL1_10390 [soil metagenome]
MRRTTLQRIQRYLAIISFAVLLVITLIGVRVFTEDYVKVLFGKQIALISGHAGYDSGAVCTDADGKTTVTEAGINATITKLVAQRLRRAGATVIILDEFDQRLDGLRADVLLSMHADSCIDNSGYKAARYFASSIGAREDELISCIDQFYPAATGQSFNPNTITHNMTDYHAFRQTDAQTPGAILETGFLGGDQDLLVNRPDVVAKGITDSLTCFFEQDQPRKADNP